MNRLQFLPHGYVITTRGCKNGAFAGIPERYLYFLAGGEPARSDTEGEAREPDDIHADIELAHPGIVPALKRILQEKRVRPVIGFELDRRQGMDEMALASGLAVIQIPLPDLQRHVSRCRSLHEQVPRTGQDGDLETAMTSTAAALHGMDRLAHDRGAPSIFLVVGPLPC